MLPVRIFITAILIFCMVNAIPAWAETWKMLVGGVEDSGTGFAARVFNNYVENHTLGQMRLELVYNEEPEAVFGKVQNGEAAFGLADLSGILRHDNRLIFPALPGLFENGEEVSAATSGEAGEILRKYAAEAGFRLLCWTWSPVVVATANRRIQKAADLAGLKLIAPPLLAKYNPFSAYGATLVARANGKGERTRQLRATDGQIGGEASGSGDDGHPGHKFTTLLNGCFEFQPLVANAKIFSRFTDNQKKIMEEAAIDARTQLSQFREEAQSAAFGMGETASLFDQLPGGGAWKTNAQNTLWPDMIQDEGDDFAEYLKAIGKNPRDSQ